MAYMIYLEDKNGKRYNASCGDACASFESGMFSEGEPLKVPEYFDDFARRYDPHESPLLSVLVAHMVDEIPVMDSFYAQPFSSFAALDGKSAYGLIVYCIGTAMMLWEDVAGADPHIRDGIDKMFGLDTFPTGEFMRLRYAASKSMVFGPILTHGVDGDKVREHVHNVSQSYASVAVYCMSGTDDKWNSIVSFGAFLHVLGGMVQNALSEYGEKHEADELADVVVKVKIVPDGELPVARRQSIHFEDQNKDDNPLVQAVRKLLGEKFAAQFAEDAVDKEVFDDDFWNQLEEK